MYFFVPPMYQLSFWYLSQIKVPKDIPTILSFSYVKIEQECEVVLFLAIVTLRGIGVVNTFSTNILSWIMGLLMNRYLNGHKLWSMLLGYRQLDGKHGSEFHGSSRQGVNVVYPLVEGSSDPDDCLRCQARNWVANAKTVILKAKWHGIKLNQFKQLLAWRQ